MTTPVTGHNGPTNPATRQIINISSNRNVELVTMVIITDLKLEFSQTTLNTHFSIADEV